MHIGLSGWAREATLGDHRRFMALLAHADRLGYDSFWLPELHFERDGLPYPSALLLAAAIAEHTERMRIGLAVALLPLQHPLLLAEALAQLDFQCGGRLDVGIGRGTAPSVLHALGIDPESTRGRFLEAYDVLRRAWAEPAVTHQGRHWQFAEAAVRPPQQRPHPPLYVAGYTRETLAFAVEQGLPVLLSLEPPEGRQLALCRAVSAASGRPYDPRPYSLTRYVCIGATEREATASVDLLLPGLHRRRQHFAARRGEDPEALPVRPPAEILRDQVIAGTPEQCIRQVEALARDPGTGRLRCVFNGNGVIPDAVALPAMELFARAVLPACRAIAPPPPIADPPTSTQGGLRA